jgi:hypothetical protein
MHRKEQLFIAAWTIGRQEHSYIQHRLEFRREFQFKDFRMLRQIQIKVIYILECFSYIFCLYSDGAQGMNRELTANQAGTELILQDMINKGRAVAYFAGDIPMVKFRTHAWSQIKTVNNNTLKPYSLSNQSVGTILETQSLKQLTQIQSLVE